MFWLAAIVVSLIALFLWLKQTTVKEKTINTNTSVCMNDLLDFMCSPVNLEKYHPYVQKITDVEATQEFVNFRMEENLGVAGKQVVPMVLKMYKDSQFAGVLRLETSSNFVKVILTFSITDNTKDTTGSSQPSSSIKLIVHVEAPRFLNLFIPPHLADVWTKALDKTKTILEH